MYVTQPAAAGEPPKNLRGFSKVSLVPGESTRVTVTLDERSFQHWTAAGWTTEGGGHRILIGASSRDIRLTGELPLRALARPAGRR